MTSHQIMQQEWTTGLCGCFEDCGICWYGWCCPCFLYGQNASKIDGSSCGGACCTWFTLLFCDLMWCPHKGTRRRLRHKYGLPETGCCNSDCCTTWCCYHCAICQEARELKNREAMSRGGQQSVIRQQPVVFNQQGAHFIPAQPLSAPTNF